MQDLLLIPTYDRPELLWLCLEHLIACPDSKEVQTIIYVDSHVGKPPPKAEIEQVVARFAPHLSLYVVYRGPHAFQGNSYNLLMAYREAYDREEVTHVFMVEDDVLIRPNFFEWHRAQHTNPSIGVSVGVSKGPHHGLYASLGVCFKRNTLKLIVPHCRHSYFENMTRYCRQTFPISRFHCEQDGLWARVLVGKDVVWATEPVAQHVGWYGYNRPRGVRPRGPLEERYQQVKHTLTNGPLLKRVSRDFQDIYPLT